jgi:predicted membrane protein
MKSENWYWPLGIIAALGFLLGYQVKVTRQDAMKQKFIAWDDDALRFAHDKVREKRLLGTVANYAIIGVIVLYFLLR